MDFLQSVAAFLVAIALLITFHEFGHFCIARRCGVKILRFSIGFGRPLWRRRGSDGTEFVVAALPLGGYVRMLDEREGEVLPAERPRAFNNKPLSHRAAIVAAGPMFNFLFAVAAYWIVFMVGVSGPRPLVGGVTGGSPAAVAGIAAGDEITGVAGRRTPTWPAMLEQVVSDVIAGRPLDLELRRANGGEETVRVELNGIDIDDLAGGKLLEALGVTPLRPAIAAVIGEVRSGGAAERDGLKQGDRIMAANDSAIKDWEQWVMTVRAHPARTIQTEIDRHGLRMRLPVTPDAIIGADGARIGQIGATVDTGALDSGRLVARERYAPPAALIRAVDKTVEMSAITLRVLVKMALGEASVRNLSGPISIAQYAGESAGIGAVSFLTFLAIVSVSLGVLNLLPIPLLDGGHLMYYLIELFTGRPVSDSVQTIGQQLGMAVLLGLMGLALYNDLMRLIG
ncbi:MAG: RIP metalloprotease RseP [Gammaproteobacteria bacterium]|nr:RIP metalloprotease RseP [Gammaproteobacteria bacterium]